MPVLSDQHAKPSMGLGGTPITPHTSSSTSTSYLFISLAVLFTLGIVFSLRKNTRNPYASASGKSHSFLSAAVSKSKIPSTARMMMDVTMQEPTPQAQAASASALPEKPYLPHPDAIGRRLSNPARDHEDGEKSGQEDAFETEHNGEEKFGAAEPEPFYSPQLQYFPLANEKVQNVNHNPTVPPFHTRLGSLPAVTTSHSLLHPELPDPTIAMAQNQNQNQNIYDPNQSQSPYQLPTPPPQFLPQNQSQYQPYTQNEILFVPSPTEYTSFEALYSKFPPSNQGAHASPNRPIYQSPNPASYASTTFSPASAHVDSSASAGEAVPRRRSYIKTLSNGSEMSGEVVDASGPGGQWRRHTRVFGGNVCIACEESERRMSA